MAYPWQFDYTMSELGIMDYSNSDEVPAADGDVILASDGSMLTFNATTNKWMSSEGTDYTFRYGKGYLYYTTVEDGEHYDFHWGNGYDLEPKDLTTAEARARKFDRVDSFWDYNPHQYPNHMAIIAKLEGLDNLEDFSIGAFVDDGTHHVNHLIRALLAYHLVGLGREGSYDVTFVVLNAGHEKRFGTYATIGERSVGTYHLTHRNIARTKAE